MECFLMRKDEVVTLCEFTEDGQLISYARKYKNPELAPLGFRTSGNPLGQWWRNRQIPLRQGRVEAMLNEQGIAGPGALMLNNLGLSLTDYYWVRPVESDLKWADVNLFENDFKENILQASFLRDSTSVGSYSPNSTLKGELEKSWVIRQGCRILIKGNHGSSSAESINEVIASRLHKRQGYDNYTDYKLIRIKNKKYDYGCYSKLFTDSGHELIPAHEVITSQSREEGVSMYEHLIRTAVHHGIDEMQFRRDLEYQILTDFLLTNVDRHMENIGILRDSDSLKFIRMAPIFDTGRAFAAGSAVPYTDYEIDNIEVNSFTPYEKDLLKLVTDPSILDMSRILPSEKIEELYRKDSKAEDFRIRAAVRLYQRKIRLLEEL